MADLDAAGFAAEWIEAWNRRDVEAVVAHFVDECVFTSPVAKQIGFSPDGVVRTKAALRRYWKAALDRNVLLHFRLAGVFEGVDTLVIRYFNQDDEERAEVLTFRGGLVIRGHGLFLSGGKRAAAAR